MNKENSLKQNASYKWAKIVLILGVLIIIFVGTIKIIKTCTSEQVDNFKKGVEVVADKTKGAINFIANKFSTKEAFAAEMISIKTQKCQELDIVKTESTMIFRGVIWRGDNMGNRNEYFECVDDRSKFKQIDAVLDQISEVQATGSYEVRYYVDMSDPSKWSSSFDENTRSIRISAPPLQASLPAEIKNIDIVTLKHSISLKDNTTREKLRDQIPRLKKQVAERNIPNMTDAGRLSLQKFFKDWLFSKYKDQFDIVNPKIEILFEGERVSSVDRKKL